MSSRRVDLQGAEVLADAIGEHAGLAPFGGGLLRRPATAEPPAERASGAGTADLRSGIVSAWTSRPPDRARSCDISSPSSASGRKGDSSTRSGNRRAIAETASAHDTADTSS